MKKSQKGFGTVQYLFVLVVLGIIGVMGWYVWKTNHYVAPTTGPPSSTSNKNTPRQNKEIEIQAAQEKNPAKCEEIRGESYAFGPTDAQITISESEAKEQCRSNIKNGIIPTLHGG